MPWETQQVRKAVRKKKERMAKYKIPLMRLIGPLHKLNKGKQSQSSQLLAGGRNSKACICSQPKLSIFVKLSKCAMDLTIAFLLSRWSKETYMERPIRSPWEDSSVWVLGKILSTVKSSDTCRKCRQPSEIPRNLKKPARVSGVIPTLGIPTCIGSSNIRTFRQASKLWTDLIKDPIWIWPFGF